MESVMFPSPTVLRGLNGLILNGTKPSEGRKQDPLEHELIPFAPSLEIVNQFQLFSQSAEPIHGCRSGVKWRRIGKWKRRGSSEKSKATLVSALDPREPGTDFIHRGKLCQLWRRLILGKTIAGAIK